MRSEHWMIPDRLSIMKDMVHGMKNMVPISMLVSIPAKSEFCSYSARWCKKMPESLLASLKPEEVLEVLSRCPVSVLKEYPLAILVLMRCMFNWKNIPKMLELKELLLASIREHPKLPEEERGNLLGECDLIQSFLMYNDISRMSQFHRSASEKMTRPASVSEVTEAGRLAPHLYL